MSLTIDRSAEKFRLVVSDVIRRMDRGDTIRLKDVVYFNHVLVADLPNPRQKIKDAISFVKAAKRTGKLDDLKTLLK